MVVPLEYVKKMPVSLQFHQAAAIPYTLMAVWDILVTQGRLIPRYDANAGTRVLICGGLRATEMLCAQFAR